MRIDRTAVLVGAVVAFSLAMPVLVVFSIVDLVGNGIGCDSNWNVVFYLGLMVSMAIGGAAAARRRLREPLSHGALAALVASAAIVVLRIVTNVSAGYGFTSRQCGVNLFAAGFTGITFSTFFGLIGGYLAERRTRPIP